MPAPDRKRRLTAFMVAMAVLIATPLAVVAADAFTDVPDSNVHHDDITWLKDNGVTAGCNPPANTEFCPGDPVLRQQMASFMRRLAENRVVDAATALEANHATTADDADTLDGASSVAYRNVVAIDAHGFFTDPLGTLSPGSHQLASVDITVPDEGLILLQGATSWESAGVDSNVVAWLELNTDTPCDSFADDDVLAGSFAETWLDGDHAFDSATASSAAAAPVNSGGSHTIYSCVTVQNGDVVPIDRTLTAQWTYSADSNATIATSGGPGGEPADLGVGTK